MGPSTVRTLWRTFANYRVQLATLVVLGFLSAMFDGVGINAAVPLLSFLLGAQTGPLDGVSQAIQALFVFVHVPFTFRYLIMFILGLFLLRAVSMTFFGYIRGKIGADFFAAESRDLQRKVLRAAWPYLLLQKMGTLQNVMVRDIQRTSNLLDTTTQVIQSFSGFIIYLLIAINISPTTTLLTVLGGAVLLLVVRPFFRRIRRVGSEIANMEKDINKFLSEQILGLKTIKAMGVEETALNFGAQLTTILRKFQMQLAVTRSVSTSLFQPFTIAFISVVFLLNYSSPNFSAVGFIATLYLIQKMFTYLESGQGALHTLGELVPYAESVTAHKQVLTEHREQAHTGGKPFVFKDSIVFKDVELSYTEGTPTIRALDLTIARGATVALIGPSGAGKTSVADVLLRLFEPTKGHLTVDGVRAGDISLTEWRTHFGYVSQDPFLFNGTIGENIRLYRDISQAEVERAAKEANIYDFVVSLSQGFDSIVGDRGVMLSGGQRQRVALARVLAGSPEVLVLDEATSALDTESEQLIQKSIQALHGKVTVFIIAHRLSTVESADTILVLERGKITEQGSPQELLQKPTSYFARHYTA